MTDTLAWVLGSGGLLGQAVLRRCHAEGLPTLTSTVAWGDPATAALQLRESLPRLAAASRPIVLWCAGAGIPSSPRSLFAVEQQVLDALLGELGTLPPQVLGRLRIFFASSAGAVYAGVEDPPYDEHSPVRPLGAYGDAKLALEEELRAFCTRTGARAVIGRISNLYGPGQNLAKSQGLVSVLLSNALLRRPSQIYVSLDTIRDYLYVDDAADLALASIRRVADEPAGSCTTKILASGDRSSVASLIGLTRQTIKRRPLIVQGASPHAKVQARDLSMRSVQWPELDRRQRTPLIEGMHRTWADLQMRHQLTHRPPQ